jgi:hypothetical protein
MKKTYMIPEALTVVLGTCKMMAESPAVGIGGGSVDAGDVEVKEEAGLSDVNLWDEEW